MFRSVTIAALTAAAFAGVAQAKKFERFSNIESNAVINRIQFGDNAVTINAPDHSFKVYSYGADAEAGAFYGKGKNTASDPGSVSRSNFISPGWFTFGESSSIEFTFDRPVGAFGFKTVDLLEAYVASDSFLSLVAYDEDGNEIDSHSRKGPQGHSGLTLGWEVGNLGRLISRAVLIGKLNDGAAGGYDDFFVTDPGPSSVDAAPLVPAPTALALAAAPLAGLGLRRKR